MYEQDEVGWAEIREVLWSLVQVYRFRGIVRSGWLKQSVKCRTT